jgi:hypothetical protein
MKMLKNMTAPDTALLRAVQKVFEEAAKEQTDVTIRIKWAHKRKSRRSANDNADNQHS